MKLKNIKSFFLFSSIGRKITIGISGIILALFVLAHMAGNLFLFVSSEAYNQYSHKLINNPFIIIFEIGLLAFFLIHSIGAISLAFYNKKVKGYNVNDSSTSLIHKTLWFQGLTIFIFILLHLYTFKYGVFYTVEYIIEGQTVVVRDLFSLVAEIFQQPLYVLWYTFCLCILFFHLNHGLQASLRSIGLYHEKYASIVNKVGLAYALIVSGGFLSQLFYFAFFYSGGSSGI